jgi:hypothetical protein
LAAVRFLEGRVVRAIGRRQHPLAISDMVRSPDEAIYLCVISILDSRKLLLQDAKSTSVRLAQGLDGVAQPELDYVQVVARLRQIALAEMQRSALRP